jgi:N-methylhydantoinase A
VTELLGAPLEPGYDRATELAEHNASIMTAPQPIARIAADIGGTFTDLAVLRADGRLATRKLPSTPANYADAVIEGIALLLGDLGAPVSALGEVLHGCTVATNAILEHKGARTALLTTTGFRDVLELRRIRVPQLYDPLYEKPAPLVPRHLRFEVTERLDHAGRVITPLDVDDVTQAATEMRRQGIEAVAVCFLHSYANPAHEREAGEILRRELPDRFITLSIDVLPQKREYERTSTTVINAYVGPPVQRYLRSMLDQLATSGVRGRLMVMQSGGGILDAASALAKPALITECGPAAGVVAAEHVARRAGYDSVITLDMGGTTAKASIIQGGRLTYADEYEVGGGMSSRSVLAGGGGYALKLPVIDISEVGAGGGSIAWLDKAGSLKVGPESAGALPGPACYGAGNQQPTVTDANVVLGYLNPRALAGGTVPIRADLARRAVAEHIAGPLGRDPLETAYGIHTVANANMMKAVKAVTTYRGRDPRDYALLAFGGSGGMHAVDLARVLQIDRVILPLAAGVFSAVGLLFSKLEVNETAPFLHRAATLPLEEAERAYGALATRIAGIIGGEAGAIRFQRQADLRFAGQAFELTVAWPEGPLDQAAVAELCRTFEAAHLARYGHAFSGEFGVEVVNLRLVGSRPLEGVGELRYEPDQATPDGGERQAYFGPGRGLVTTPVLDRSRLSDRPRLGPMIIEEYEGTAVVPPDCTARLDPLGNVVIELPHRHQTGPGAP